MVYLSVLLIGKMVGLEEVRNNIYQVYFRKIFLGYTDFNDLKICDIRDCIIVYLKRKPCPWITAKEVLNSIKLEGVQSHNFFSATCEMKLFVSDCMYYSSMITTHHAGTIILYNDSHLCRTGKSLPSSPIYVARLLYTVMIIEP